MGQLLEQARKHTRAQKTDVVHMSPLAMVYFAAKSNALPLWAEQDGNQAVLGLVEHLRSYRSVLSALGQDYLDHPNTMIYIAQWQEWAEWWAAYKATQERNRN